MSPFYIRPIAKDDFENFKDLAFSVRGMTSLPKDEKLLEKKIKKSLHAFDDDDVTHPGGESYLFALIEAETGKLIGISGIISKVGGFEPFYSYKIKTETLYSEALDVKRDMKTLHLSINHNGPTEICSLLLNPNYRAKGLGRLLSLSRFLFMAEFPDRFDKEVISEMRGVNMPGDNEPPFWECVSRHFFDTDFLTADHLCSLGKKDFIADLMPKHPLYFDLLSRASQKVIGEVHEETKPARKLLESEGFRFKNEVDIFDGGPTLKAVLKSLRSIKFSKVVTIVESSEPDIDSLDFLVSNRSLQGYRSCIAHLDFDSSGNAIVPKTVLKNLSLQPGDQIRFVPLR